MSPTPSFGRRAPAPATRPRPAAESAPSALSEEAEAFRLALKGATDAPSEFGRWRDSQRLDRWGAWALSFALTASGLLSFVLNAPVWLSVLFEIAGFALGLWLRRARRRRIAEVAAWEPEAPV